MVGMLVHLDASTHEWIAGLLRPDSLVALDDADGHILYAQFFPQEGEDGGGRYHASPSLAKTELFPCQLLP
jgi:hypothetical protein